MGGGGVGVGDVLSLVMPGLIERLHSPIILLV